MSNNIQFFLKEFFTEINQKYPSKIDVVSLEKEWELLTATPSGKTREAGREPIVKPVETIRLEKCRHKMLTGPRRGEDCGAEVKTRPAERVGQFYCVKHYKKYCDDGEAPPIPPSPSSIKSDIIIRLDKSIGKFTHKLTGMVFHSYAIRQVYGRVENNKILPLSEEDIETCKKYGFIVFCD